MKEIKVYSHELTRSKKSFPSFFWVFALLIPIGISLIITDVVRGTFSTGAFAIPGVFALIIAFVGGAMYLAYKSDMRQHPFLILRKDEVSIPYSLDIKSSYMWHPTYNSAVNEYFDSKLKIKSGVDENAWKDQFIKMNEIMKNTKNSINFLDKTRPSRNYADELSIQENELNFTKE